MGFGLEDQKPTLKPPSPTAGAFLLAASVGGLFFFYHSRDVSFWPVASLGATHDPVAFGGEAECAGRPARSRWWKSITMKE